MASTAEFPDSKPVWLKVVASFPLLAVLIFFLIETAARSRQPPYSEPYPFEDDGNDKAYIALPDMLWAFLAVAQLSSIVTVLVLFVFPLKHELLKRFVDEGQTILGDVFFHENYKCIKPYGEVTYAHPSPQYEKTYIRREANIYERYSREWVTLLMLPNLPFSAQPRADLEIAYVASERRNSKMRLFGYYALGYTLFALLSPMYIVYVMSTNKEYAELGGYGWYYYAVLAGVNPLIAIAVNYIVYTEHFNWMMRGNARLLQEGEARVEEAAALPVAQTDLSGYRYLPMEYTKSQGSNNSTSKEQQQQPKRDDGQSSF